MAARSFLEKDPQYTFAAARFLLLALYQEALGHPVIFEGMKTEYATYFTKYIHRAVELDLLSPNLLQFDLKLLGHYLKPKRDLLLHYMGLQTLYDRYFIHWEKRRLELPQIFWMRVAMGLAKKEGAKKNEKAMEFYDVLSTFRFTSSTPTLFNSGTRHSQLSSCFLTTIEDDLSHIFKCVQDDAMLSKWSAGSATTGPTSAPWAHGSRGPTVKSQGIIPFMKVANDTAVAGQPGAASARGPCARIWKYGTWILRISWNCAKIPAMNAAARMTCTRSLWIPDLS